MSRAVSGLVTAALFTLVVNVCHGSENSKVVMGNAQIKVTVEDIQRYIVENIPEVKRAEVLNNPKIFRDIAENIFVIRSLAAEAEKEQNFDKEQAEWVADLTYRRWLLSEYRGKLIDEAFENFDWDAAAKEVYVAEAERFIEPEQVSVSHVLIKTQCRNDDEAQKMANSIRELALSGDDFSTLAAEFSEDPSVRNNKGDLGYFPRGAMAKPLEEAAFAMTSEGEISEVIKTKFGYHVIRFNGRKAAEKQTFEEVKDEITAELKKNLSDKIWQDKIIAARSAPTIKIDDEALNQLADKYGEKTGSD